MIAVMRNIASCAQPSSSGPRCPPNATSSGVMSGAPRSARAPGSSLKIVLPSLTVSVTLMSAMVVGFDRRRVFRQDGEVGQLAGARLPLVFSSKWWQAGQIVIAFKRGDHVDPVLGADDAARAAGAAGDGGVEHAHRVRERHRRIVVAGEDHAALRGPAGGRDVHARLRADGVVAVPVAPVEGVHREQRRDDAERLVAVELVLAQELAVDQHRAQVLRLREARLGRPMGGDQQVGGRSPLAWVMTWMPFSDAH